MVEFYFYCKMKKCIVIALAMVLCVFGVKAQNMNISWTEKDKSGLSWYGNIVGWDGSYVYRVADSKGYYIQRLDKQFKVLEQKALSTVMYEGVNLVTDKQSTMKDIVVCGSHKYIAFLLENKESMENKLIVSEIKNDLLVDSAKLITTYQPFFRKSQPNGLISSPNHSSLLFYNYDYSPNTGGDFQRITLTVLDEKLNEKWQRIYDLPFNRGQAHVSNLQLSDDGNVICGTVSIYLGTQRHYLFNKNGSSELLPPTNADITWHYNKMKLSSDGKTILYAATYRNHSSVNTDSKFDITGVFIGSYNTATNQFQKQKFQKFDNDVFAKLDQGGDYNITYVSKVDYEVNGIDVSKNGDIAVMIDRIYFKNIQVGSPGSEYSYGSSTFPVNSTYAVLKEPFEKMVYSFNNQYEKKYAVVINRNLRNKGENIYYPNTVNFLGDDIVAIYHYGLAKGHKLYTTVIDSKGLDKQLELSNDKEFDSNTWYFDELGKLDDNSLLIAGKSGYGRKYGVIQLD